ncbi:MAG: FlgD immunoglobulin-like domain containing protein, partial [Bacillota bacterium]
HVDNTPAGDVNLNTGINGGTKFYDPTKVNMIRGKAPYYWLVSATNSLGASQLFDVELQGTNLKRKFETVNDLRIIRRFDGDITVNGWFLQGNAGNYSNILQANNPNPGDTIITVRNIASMGGIVSQAALFTIGVPSQAPLFTTAGTLANTAINEGSTFTFQYQAQDPDVNGNGIVYSLVNPVTNATLTSAGLLTFKPDYTQGTNDYTFTVKAAKANDLTSSTTTTAVITVNNVNQAPAFTTAGKLADQTIKNGQLLEFNYAATDADAGDALTYSLVNPPAGVAITAAGKLTWTPTFDQISTTPYVITVKVTDNGTPAQSATTVANITVKSARLKGDVTNDGIVASNDASKVLQMVVGSIATPAAASEDFYAADAKADNLIGAMDAYYILSYVNNGKYPDNTLAKETVTGDIAFGRISSKEEIVTVPVTLTGAQNVHSIKLSLDVDNNLVDLSAVNSSLPEGWMMLHNYADGKLNIVMVGLEPVSNGTVASINFALKNKEARAELAGTISLNDAPESALSKIGVKQVPAQFELSQNYPNPFNPTTTVKYSLAVDTKVTLSVYNMVGQKIRTLVDGQQESGYYSINWDGTNELGQKVASGIYIYRLETGSFISSKKMNLLK